MKITVVLVTYNRIDCLKTALSRYEAQTMRPEYIIVVDNASTDGTFDFLDEWGKEDSGIQKIVIHNEKNLGGAGGFYTGLAESIKYDFDYAFLADDDAYADQDTFEKLFEDYKIVNAEMTAAICTCVINHDRLDISHRCRVKKGSFNIRLQWVPEREYEKDYFELDIVTFVGAAIKKKTIDQIGLPLKDYFIYYDDTEYFMRIKEIGKVFCVPTSKMTHDTDGKASINSWKGYYDTRNWLDAVNRHYGKKYFNHAVFVSYIRRCSVLSGLLRKRSKSFRRMCKVAIADAINGKTGISDIYYPSKRVDTRNK